MVFLRAPLHAAAATAAILLPLRDIAIVPTFPPAPTPAVRIRAIRAALHPARGQHGLFATRPIARGTLILCYAGRVLPRDHPECAASDYVLGLGRDLAVDAARAGNEARFINDYRGIAARPNVRFAPVACASAVDPAALQVPAKHVRMGVWAVSDIPAGNELLVSYGKAFWAARTAPPSL